MRPDPRMDVLGSGARFIRVLNLGLTHSVPIWPLLRRRGRGGNSEPPDEPPAEKPGEKKTEAKIADRRCAGALYYNYVAQYPRCNPDSSVEGAVSHQRGKFKGPTPDSALKADEAGRLRQARFADWKR